MRFHCALGFVAVVTSQIGNTDRGKSSLLAVPSMVTGAFAR